MSPTSPGFSFSFSHAVPQPRPDDEAPQGTLVLADLGGDRSQPLARRSALRIDIDRFDAVFARIAPRLEAVGDGGQALAFGSIDDFRPEALRSRVDHLVQVAAAPAAGAPAASSSAASDIERLLGRAPSAPAEPTPLQAWLQAVVQPHVKPAAAPAATPQATPALRALLHHPRFQALESAWRGVDALTRAVDFDETRSLWLLDATAEECAADLDAHGSDLSASALHRVLHASGLPRWTLTVVDQAFGDAELPRLAALGAIAARAGAVLLADAAPARLDTEGAVWQALRESPMAPHIGLLLPRVLMRLPYGPRTDPVSGLDFDELPPGAPPEGLLWGSAALAAARLAAGAEGDWPRLLDDLPALVLDTADGERRLQPATEWALGDEAVRIALERGLMPWQAHRTRPLAQLPRWQSIAPGQDLRRPR